jgi:site-specific recombinase XerC
LAFHLDENARQIREGLKAGPVDGGVILSKIVSEFENHLSNRDLTSQRVFEVISKVNRVFSGCGFKRLVDCDSSKAEQFLALLRSEGMSKQTSNHYTKTLKQFGNWVVKTRRTTENPFSDLSILNVQTDRRHDRRPLTAEEFARLVRAAESGSSIESISGVDRAMMYVLSAWTGYGTVA